MSRDIREHLMMGLSILSAVSSATIIAAYAGIPAVRKRKYFEALFYIGISNFITSVGSSFGLVKDESIECWAQGILTNVFSLASIAWTVVISLMLNYSVTRAVLLDVTPLMHVICWTLPVIVTLVPLTEVSFSSDGGKYWCFFQSSEFERLVMWRWIGFYGWVMLGVAIILALFLNMFCKKTTMITEKAFLRQLFHKLKYYPFIIIICWLPGAVYDSMPGNAERINAGTTAFSCLHGLLLAIVFWAQNYRVLRNINSRGKSAANDAARAGGNLELFDNYKSTTTSTDPGRETDSSFESVSDGYSDGRVDSNASINPLSVGTMWR